MRSVVLITPGGVCTINQTEKRAANIPAMTGSADRGYVTASAGAPNAAASPIYEHIGSGLVPLINNTCARCVRHRTDCAAT
jgi:hypothetical protein